MVHWRHARERAAKRRAGDGHQRVMAIEFRPTGLTTSQFTSRPPLVMTSSTSSVYEFILRIRVLLGSERPARVALTALMYAASCSHILSRTVGHLLSHRHLREFAQKLGRILSMRRMYIHLMRDSMR